MNIAAIDIHSSGLELATGSRDYSVKIWDITTSQCKQSYSASRNVVTSLIYASNSDSNANGNSNSNISHSHLLYQGGEDLSVRGWDTRSSNSKPALHMKDYIYFPTCISTLPSDCNYFSTGCKGFNSTGCEVKVWDIRKTDKAILVFNGHTHDVNDCIYLNQSHSTSSSSSSSSAHSPSYSAELLHCILSCSKDGSIALWDTRTNEKVAWLSGCSRHFISIALLPSTSVSTNTSSSDNKEPNGSSVSTTATASASAMNSVNFMVGAYDGSLTYCILSPSNTNTNTNTNANINANMKSNPGLDMDMDSNLKYCITIQHSTSHYEYTPN